MLGAVLTVFPLLGTCEDNGGENAKPATDGQPLKVLHTGLDIELKVQETAGVVRLQDPCRSGIPVAPGVLKNLDNLRWVNGKGDEVPSQLFFLGLASDAFGRYCESFPEDKKARKALVSGMAEFIDYYRKLTPEQQKTLREKELMEKVVANGMAFATRFSGDPVYLDFASKELMNDAGFCTNFRNGACSTKMWTETRSSHRLIQIFMHDIDKKKHPEKYDNLP